MRSLLWEVCRFECRNQLRSPLFAALAATFFLLGFLITASEKVSVGGLGNNLNFNAPFAIVQIQYVLSMIGMLAAVAIVGLAATRDFDAKMAEILFASGVGERSWLLGRFIGGWLFATLAVLAGLLGTLVAAFMPWLDPNRVGAFAAEPYLFAVWGVLLPNLLVICALFFGVAVFTRSIVAAYVTALGFMVLYVVVSIAADQQHTRWLALADPFGISAFGDLTRYWTVFERNTQVPALEGALLYNRIIWIGAALLMLLATVLRFRFNLAPTTRGGAGGLVELLRIRLRRKTPMRTEAQPKSRQRLAVRSAVGWQADLARLRSQLRMDVRGIVRSVPFYVLLAFGLFNVAGGFYGSIAGLYGTPVLPVTDLMIRVVEGSFLFVVFIIIVYYSGELVHRERQLRVVDVLDATPYPSGIMVLAKVGALWFVITALLLVMLLTSILVQTLNGYHHYELGLYLAGLFAIGGFWFYLWCIPAVLIQVLAPGKFSGMLMFLLVFMGLQTLPSLGFEHNLYLFSAPQAPYSAMNGFGHFILPVTAFSLYWLCFAVLLLMVAHLLYPRGSDTGWRVRMSGARSRFVGELRWSATAAALVMASLGAWIFYNTNVLNDYQTKDDRELALADYEKRYQPLSLLPQPSVIDLDVKLEIYPEQRRLESRGSALLANDLDHAIDELHFTLAPHLSVLSFDVPGGELVEEDVRLGYYRYRLTEALRPGEQRTVSWDLAWRNPGFENAGSTTRVVANGTFVNNGEIAPMLGYDAFRALEDNSVRRKHGLPPVQRLPALGDPQWLDVAEFRVRRRTAFRAQIGTAADQIALAPGYLQREWTEGGRRYFAYEMDAPIWPFVSFTSARYAVARDQWNDVALEVYYHPQHGYNVDAMLRASKRSLDYFTREFSPYQYRQFRILEFPGYATFAQAFPNTIPYSEAIGFVADLRKPDRIDYVFYVTAHELAHQWWGHQVAGAYMQGSTMITETLAQYSALMVQEAEYGPEKMRRFLKFELDNYLKSRGGELIEELPLVRVEGQGYIHYRKGSLAMYALKDYVGEQAVNQALRSFLQRFAFVDGPYPTASDLVAEFRAVAGSEHQALITDLFEKIVLFDLKVTAAVVTPVADGFEVAISIDARKFEADGAGQEREVPLDYQLDVGIFPQQDRRAGESDLPQPLLLEKQRIVSGSQVLTFKVPAAPAQVGIDPYNKMIDRNPEDNLLRL